MRHVTLTLLALLISLSALVAQDATVNVVHGVPGLPAPVEVRANGNALFTFDYGDVEGPLTVPAGPYTFEVVLNGSPILSLSATLDAGVSYTAVAHLLEGGTPTLSAFVDDLSESTTEDARLVVRHLADAPAVDVEARRAFFFFQPYQTIVAGAANGDEAALELDDGFYAARIRPAGGGSVVAGPVGLGLPKDKVRFVHAVGEVGTPSFQLITFVRSQRPVLPALTATVSGVSGGGLIDVSTPTPAFGQAFQVGLTGGRPDASGFFHLGRSDDRLFFFIDLPLDLSNLGAPGNFLYQSTENIHPITLDATGATSVDVTIPVSVAPWFDGAYCQFSYFDGNANALGLVLSDLLSIEQ